MIYKISMKKIFVSCFFALYFCTNLLCAAIPSETEEYFRWRQLPCILLIQGKEVKEEAGYQSVAQEHTEMCRLESMMTHALAESIDQGTNLALSRISIVYEKDGAFYRVSDWLRDEDGNITVFSSGSESPIFVGNSARVIQQITKSSAPPTAGSTRSKARRTKIDMGNRFIVEGQNFRFIVAGTVDCEPSLEGQYPLQDFLLRLFNFTKMNPPPPEKEKTKAIEWRNHATKKLDVAATENSNSLFIRFNSEYSLFLLKNILRESQFPQNFHHSEQWWMQYISQEFKVNEVEGSRLYHKVKNLLEKKTTAKGGKVFAIVLHIHFKNDVCSCCTPTLSAFSIQQSRALSKFKQQTLVENPDHFHDQFKILILASSRVNNYPKRRTYHGHGATPEPPHSINLETFPPLVAQVAMPDLPPKRSAFAEKLPDVVFFPDAAAGGAGAAGGKPHVADDDSEEDADAAAERAAAAAATAVGGSAAGSRRSRDAAAAERPAARDTTRGETKDLTHRRRDVVADDSKDDDGAPEGAADTAGADVK